MVSRTVDSRMRILKGNLHRYGASYHVDGTAGSSDLVGNRHACPKHQIRSCRATYHLHQVKNEDCPGVWRMRSNIEIVLGVWLYNEEVIVLLHRASMLLDCVAHRN